jgi:hypothetical protein
MAASIAATCAISELIKLRKKSSMDGKIMRYGDTMGRDGESLALKLWRGSAVAAPTVPKHRQLVYCETPCQ